MMKVNDKLSNMFTEVDFFATSSYLVELISQLENDQLIGHIFNRKPDLCKNFPQDCYANDQMCIEFLLRIPFDSSIFCFESLSIGQSINSGKSYCQITANSVTALLSHNDFAAPIQFDLNTIRNVKLEETKIFFNLSRPAKKALINFEVSSTAVVTLVFDTIENSKEFLTNLAGSMSEVAMPSPMKTSVAENFITLKGSVDDYAADDEDEVANVESFGNEVREQTNSPKDSEHGYEGSENSGIIDESESIFGSPINTTKDTTAPKRAGRAVSAIVAESKGDDIKSNPLAFLQTPSQTENKDQNSNDDNYEQVPDSLDEAFQTFKNPPVQRGPSDVIIESVPDEEKKLDFKKATDIWDFDSDPEVTILEPRATSTVPKSERRSKAMKCLTEQMIVIAKKGPGKTKTNKDQAKLSVQSKLNVKLEKSNKSANDQTSKFEYSSIDMADNQMDSFQPLTSPLVGAHERARTRAFSKSLDKFPEPQDTVEKTKTKRTIEEEDESYRDEDEVISVLPKKARKVVTMKTAKQGQKPKAKSKAKPKAGVKKGGRKEKGEPEAEEQPKEKKIPGSKENNTHVEETSRSKAPFKPQQSKTNASNHTVQRTNIAAAESSDNQSKSKVSNKARDLDTTVKVQNQVSLSSFHPQMPLIASTSAADSILSEAYTNTLQRQIFESITNFSDQLVKKIHIINDEINKKVMTDLTSKYETLFNDLRDSFQSDVDEMCGFITDVKGLLNLPEQELVDYIKEKKFGSIAPNP